MALVFMFHTKRNLDVINFTLTFLSYKQVKYQCYDLLLPVVINDDRHFIMLV